jgi:hypothetical protein
MAKTLTCLLAFVKAVCVEASNCATLAAGRTSVKRDQQKQLI